jgi:hypothetical protein
MFFEEKKSSNLSLSDLIQFEKLENPKFTFNNFDEDEPLSDSERNSISYHEKIQLEKEFEKFLNQRKWKISKKNLEI